MYGEGILTNLRFLRKDRDPRRYLNFGDYFPSSSSTISFSVKLSLYLPVNKLISSTCDKKVYNVNRACPPLSSLFIDSQIAMAQNTNITRYSLDNRLMSDIPHSVYVYCKKNAYRKMPWYLQIYAGASMTHVI